MKRGSTLKKNTWACFLLILVGIVIGGLLGNLFPSTWINYGETFGLTSPIVLDLGILVIQFALTIKITVASILGVMVALVIYHFL